MVRSTDYVGVSTELAPRSRIQQDPLTIHHSARNSEDPQQIANVVPTLASISPKREVHAFELTQVPDLYDVTMHSFAVSDSMVAPLSRLLGKRKKIL